MIIYECKLGIKVIGKANDYNEEIEREYGRRNLFITDEKTFKKFHFCVNEKYNYWLPNRYKDMKGIYEKAAKEIESVEEFQKKAKKNHDETLKEKKNERSKKSN